MTAPAGFRLSRQQRRLWELGRAWPGTRFHAEGMLELRGPLDVAALRAALDAVCRRHEVLRTAFPTVPGASWPLQVVAEAASAPPLPMATADLAVLAAARHPAALEAARAALVPTPFDLERGPLLRACLVRLHPHRHLLLLTLPALVADGRTVALLAADLARALAPGGIAALAADAEPLQHVDYAEWQRELGEGDGAAAGVAFWRRRTGVAGAEAVAVAALAREPGATARVRVRSLAARGAELEEVAARLASSVPDLLLAGWQALLWRLAGESAPAIAVGTDGRPFADLEGVWGPLAVHLPLRLELASDTRFCDLVAQAGAVRGEGLAAQEHFSWELLRRADQVTPPLLPYGFEVAEAETVTPAGEVELRLAACEARLEPFQLRLTCREESAGWRAAVACGTRFAAATAEALGASLDALLAAAGREPDARLDELARLEAEAGSGRRTALAVAAPTAVPAVAGTFHERFATQVARTPNAPAVACEDRRLTYRQLERRARLLAHRLRALGVGPESPVGICLDRSLEMIVALLATLEAGGAYVPLDPRFPLERLTFQVEDAGIEVLLTSGDLAAGLSERLRRVDLALLASELGDGDAELGTLPRPGSPSPANAAYVVYTSGSTGRPKGVVVEHRQLLNYVDGILPRLGLPDGAVAATLSTLGADLGNTVIFPILATGGCVHVVPHDRLTSAPALAAYLDEHAVDVVKIVPSHLQGLLAQESPAAPLPRRLLVLGGEAASGELVGRLRRLAPGCAILNHYGPTETTIGVTTHRVTEATAVGAGGTLPIGCALARCDARVVDGELRALPPGVPGELVIGGDSVARGYRGRPAATAERFLPDPFAPQPGGRLYRTGDRAVLGFDGELRFLGRLDHQVKLRGYRIELGEVEAALRRHPRIAAAVVTVREDHPGERRLVAYVVGHDGAELTVPELRRHLEASLPDYMVPAAFVPLPALPLNANGKLDRAALPVPEAVRRLPAAVRVAPRDARERALAAIWCEVLHLDGVGVEDNFFALGGDSILCIQVVSRARRAGLALTPRQLFEQPTIAELARVAGVVGPASAPPPAPARAEIPLAPIQRWFFERDFDDAAHWNNSLLLEVARDVAPATLRRAAAAVVAHHEALRLRFLRAAEGWQQTLAADGVSPPFHVADLSTLPAVRRTAALERLCAATQGSLSLERGPLVRFVAIDLGPGEARRLVVVVHHLAVDAVSWRVLLDDLRLACRQAARGEPIDLGPPSAAYRDWCAELVRQAEAPEVTAQLEHWGAAGDAPGELPRDHDRGPNVVGAADAVTVRLDAARTRALLREAPRAFRADAQDLLVAALLRAVASWTGRASLVLGMEGHGREAVEPGLDLSRTVGWLTARYPVRLEVPAGDDPGALVKAVKQQLREVPRRGVGYGLLRYLGGEEAHRRLGAQPPPPLGFNYLGQVDSLLDGDATWRPASEGSGRDRSPRGTRVHLLEVNCLVRDGALQASWIFSRHAHRRATIERLAEAFVVELARLVDHAMQPRAGGYTPSDFPLAALDQTTLDRLAAGREPGSAREIEDLYPLAPIQEGMLFHTLYAPGSELYLEQLSCAFEGVDEAAFTAAWELLVRRHAALRTAVLWEGLQRPLQCVERRPPLPIERHDWGTLHADEELPRLAALLREDRSRGFDLATAPLMRLHWIRLAGERRRFVWTHHHLLTDGWSTAVLLGELFEAYTALRRGAAPSWPPARSYRDYVVLLAARDRGREESFWRRYLEGLDAPTPLPAGAPPASTTTAEAPAHGEASLRLPPADTRALMELARRHHLTLNTLVQGAWALLLARATGVSDVVFGVTVAGRPAELEGVERIVGPFLNTLPLRVRVDEEATAVDWLRRLQAGQVAVLEHQSSALADVQAWSPLGRGQPLFESLLVFENYPVAAALAGADPGVVVDDVRAHVQLNYPLAVVAIPGESLRLYSTFDRRRLRPVEVRRLLHELATLLAALGAAAGDRVAAVSPLAPAARHRLLVEWNDVPAPAGAATLPELLARWAGRTPAAPAVVYGAQRLSYGELDAAVENLARRLGALGIGREVPVAVALERTPILVVAALAVMRAGGVYLPLDPELPAERLAFVLRDAATPLLLTSSALRQRVAHAGPRVVCLDEEGEGLAPETTTPLPAGIDPLQAAYVIYTSGSTGPPKGVVLHHGGLANLAAAQAAGFGVRAGDRVLQFASPSFDAAVSEIAMALFAGATLVLADAATLADPEALARTIDEGRVDVVTLPPTMLRVLPAARGRPRVVVSAGEACTADVVERWSGGHQLINAYGPSEATVCASFGRCELPTAAAPAAGIGRPLAGTRCHLLDAWLRPVPAGAVGELGIAGAGVGRGYLGRPGLTAESFLPDPFATTPGSRLYRSGDLARYRHDGSLELVGRRDRQLKIRGHRVEPGEIEASLRRHPGVRDAVVVARPQPAHAAAGERLVAYVVAPPSPRPRLELWPSVAEYFIYDDALYHAMTHDELRNQRYREALSELVPGRTVVDVGTGPEAILARLCVEAGARHVYAVELLESSFVEARRRIHELGLDDRVTLLHGDAAGVALPEPVDVCVSEIVGAIGGSEGAAAILNAARRLLRPGGRMVPERAVTRIAAVTLPDELVGAPAFSTATAGYVRRIFAQVGRSFDLRLCLKGVTLEDLISDADVFEDLDFRAPVPLVDSHRIELHVQRRARLDGFLVWLHLHTAGEHQLDILADAHCWLPVWLPVFDPGIEVAPGGCIRATVRRTLCANERNPDFRIEGELLPGEGTPRPARVPFVWESPHAGESYRGTSFYRRLFAADGIPVEPTAGAPTTAALRAHLESELPAYMVPATFVFLDTLPLTTSGKVDLRRLPDPDGARPELADAYTAPRNEIEERLAAIFAEVLGVDAVGAHDDFFALGGDSILSIQVVGQARRAGLRLTPQQLFQQPTVAALAAVAARRAAPQEADAGAEPARAGEAFPLTPIQHWFFEQSLERREHWNQSLLLELYEPLPVAVLGRAWATLVEHHAALRLRFTRDGAGWRQEYAPAAAELLQIDLAHLVPAERRQALEVACAGLQASLSLDGVPARAALFGCGAGADRLLLAVHHLVVDGVSWRILLADLEAACRQLSRGERPDLGVPSDPYRRWAEGLAARADGESGGDELAYWRQLATCRAELPRDHRLGENLWGSREVVTAGLDGAATAALLATVASRHVEVPELLLTAVARSVAAWSGAPELLVDLEGHGRDEELVPGIDLSRTVGWFTALYPVLLPATGGEPSAALAAIRERLRAVPRHGVGFGLLRYLGPDLAVREELAALPRPEVSFDYLGRFDALLPRESLFGLAEEPSGASADPASVHPHALTVSAMVTPEGLRLSWGYSRHLHRRETIAALADRCLVELASLAGAAAAGRERYLATDFPLVTLSEQELAALPAGIEDLYPLTGMQEVMVEVARRLPAEAGVYHCQQSYALRDPALSPPALTAAFAALVRQNPVLRSVLLPVDGPHLQAVWRDLAVPVEVRDISLATPTAQDEAVEAWLLADRRRPFDPGDPLLRAALFVRGRERAELCLAMHHAITDGWGQVALLAQLHELYAAAKRGEALAGPVRANVFRELVALERQIRRAEDAAAFWDRHLAERQGPTLLQRQDEARFERSETALPAALVEALRRYQRERRVSLKAVLLAAFVEVWGERHGLAVPSVGVVTHGRADALSDPLGALGLFWNLVPFTCARGAGGGELVEQVHRLLGDLEPHALYPLPELVRRRGEGELFAATFNFVQLQAGSRLAAAGGVELIDVRGHDRLHYPLNVTLALAPPPSASEVDGSLRLAADYDTRHVTADEVAAMTTTYLEVLEGWIGESLRPAHLRAAAQGATHADR